MTGEWLVLDHDNDNRQTASSRSGAEDMAATAREFGSDDVEIVPPDDSDGATTDGGDPADATIVDHAPDAGEDHDAEYDLPERSVGEDPLNWVPGEFVDEFEVDG